MEQFPILRESDAVALLSRMPDVESVRALEDVLLEYPQVHMPVEHFVHGGVSARTIMIPAGTCLTGALTNIDNICVVCGDITVTTDDGPQRLTGFHVLQAKAGSKRAGIAHADTWWTTLHHTKKTNITEIEDEMSNEASCLGSRRLLNCTEGLTQ